jgi:triacylglycerol lipase
MEKIDKAIFLAELSKEIYKDINDFKWEKYGLPEYSYIENEETDTQCVVFKMTKREIIIVFRGTQSIHDWMRDFDYDLGKIDWINPHIRVHDGFKKGYKSVRKEIFSCLSEGLLKVTICGHSLGGSLACLCALDLKVNFFLNVECFTFGSPRVGDKNFRNLFNYLIKDSYRFVNEYDIVTILPFKWSPMAWFKYFHVDKRIKIGNNLRSNLLRKIIPNFESHKMSNYIKSLEQSNK